MRLKFLANNKRLACRVFALFVSFLIFVYLIIKALAAFGYQEEYVFDLLDQKKNEKATYNLRLKKDLLSSDLYRELMLKVRESYKVLASPIELVFEPEEFLLDHKEIAFEGAFSGDYPIRLSFYCEICKKEKENPYVSYNFYEPKLKDYFLIAQFEEGNVYSKSSLLSEVENKNLYQWLTENFVNNESIFFGEKDFNLLPYVKKHQSSKDSNIKINGPLRAPREFWFYSQGDMDLSLVKRDYNYKSGADAVQLFVTDVNDKTLAEFLLKDDSVDFISKNSAGYIRENFKLHLPGEGLYKLKFNELGRSQDWFIESLELNTNKFISNDALLVNKGQVLFFDLANKRKVSFDSVQSKPQTFVLSSSLGDKNEIFLERNARKEVLLGAGSYKLDVRGEMFVDAAHFAFNKEHFFQPFRYDFKQISDDPDLIVLDTIQVSEQQGQKVSRKFKSKDLKNFFNFKFTELNFSLINVDLERVFDRRKNFYDRGFELISKLGDYELWGRDADSGHFAGLKQEVSKEDLLAWLQVVVPQGKSIYDYNTGLLEKKDFLASGPLDDFQMYEQVIDGRKVKLRGEHEFFVLAEGDFRAKINLEKLKVADNTKVQISLLSPSALELCSSNEIEVSEIRTIDFLCPNLDKGLYVLAIKDVDNEKTVLIRKLGVNTNKMMIKDSVYTLDPIDFYFSRRTNSHIGLYFWREAALQDLALMKAKRKEFVQTISLEPVDRGKRKEISLPEGDFIIRPLIGDIILYDENFALTFENWFRANTHILRQDFSADFLLFKNDTEKAIYMNDFRITVE